MEILGSLSSRVDYDFKNVSMSIEAFKRSGILQKIKEKYSFSEIEQRGSLIGWQGGSFTHDSKKVIIGQAYLNASEAAIAAIAIGESSDSEAFLDSLCEFIDSFKLFDPLCGARKEVSYSTVGRAKINVSPLTLISEDYIGFLKEKSALFETKHYSVEVQPIGFTVAILLKPNLSEISKLSLGVAEMTHILQGAGSKEFTLRIESVDDYNSRTYTFGIRFDSETARNILTDLEKQFGES